MKTGSTKIIQGRGNNGNHGSTSTIKPNIHGKNFINHDSITYKKGQSRTYFNINEETRLLSKLPIPEAKLLLKCGNQRLERSNLKRPWCSARFTCRERPVGSELRTLARSSVNIFK